MTINSSIAIVPGIIISERRAELAREKYSSDVKVIVIVIVIGVSTTGKFRLMRALNSHESKWVTLPTVGSVMAR